MTSALDQRLQALGLVERKVVARTPATSVSLKGPQFDGGIVTTHGKDIPVEMDGECVQDILGRHPREGTAPGLRDHISQKS